MNERIKILRKKLNLTQQQFADKIKVKRNTVATYEMGRSIPSDSAIALICKTFHVNEEWIRSGNGEIFEEVPEEDEKDAFVSSLLDAENDPFYKIIEEIMRTFDQLSPKSQEAIRDFSGKLLENLKKEKES